MNEYGIEQMKKIYHEVEADVENNKNNFIIPKAFRKRGERAVNLLRYLINREIERHGENQ